MPPEHSAATLILLLAPPALWLDRRLALGLLAAGSAAGLVSGALGPVGGAALLGFAGLAGLHDRPPEPRRPTTWALLVAASAALYLHLVPGFPAWPVLGPVTVGQGAPYEKWISLDKTGAGLLLLALAVPATLSRRGWPPMLRRAAPALLLTPPLTAAAALAAGRMALDVTLVPLFFAWAWLNLFTTCLSEEALFRGLFQARLAAWTTCRGWTAHPAVLLTALIFGLVHLPGGPSYACAAAVAGVGYGYAFQWTGRIEAAMLTHFAVNALHFLLLTYPYPAA